MRRIPRQTVWIAALILAGVPALAQGGQPSKYPVAFKTLTAVLHASESASLACEVPTNAGTGEVFGAVSITNPSGQRVAMAFVAISTSRDLYLGASVVGGQAARTIAENVPPGRTSGLSHSISTPGLSVVEGSTLRVAWAAWGPAGSCSVRVADKNGVVAWTAAGASAGAGAATFLNSTDFNAGASATTSSADVAAAQSWSKVSDGYLFALLAPDRGFTSVRGPNGEESAAGPGSLPWIGVAQPTSGSWTYSVTAVSDHKGALLWLLEVPL